MTNTRATVTSTAILDAAEQLFARHGHDKTSMRQITTTAGVNLAAIHYHFGSKEQLIQAVFKRRLSILNEERLQILDALEAQAAGQPLKPSQVVEAFFSPLVRHAYCENQGSRPFTPLIEHSRFDQDGFIGALFTEEHSGVVVRFRRAFQQALPNVPLEEILWRFNFMLGATSYAIMGMDALRTAVGLAPQPESKRATVDEVLQRLLSFLLGGLRAPLPGQPALHPDSDKPDNSYTTAPPASQPDTEIIL